MVVTVPFQTLFAVPMHCDGCVKSVTDALHKLGGIVRVEADLKGQLVTVEGTAPPSTIVQAIQATGKDAILRGSGTSNGAAVSILETYHERHVAAAGQGPGSSDRLVRGLARMVQVSPTTTLVDLTMRGVSPGLYRATLREYGNLEHGAVSAGPIWSSSSSSPSSVAVAGAEDNDMAARGNLGTVQVGPDDHGSVFLASSFQVWEVIGHALVVARQGPGQVGDSKEESPLTNDPDTVVGVIARSAGMWDNDKTVCSCTGKTLWEERKDETRKGMI